MGDAEGVAVNHVLADDGCRLWIAEAGRGTPLILCHGGPGLWDMFEDLVPALAGRFRVIRWDQRGCGRSERRGPYSVARSVADLDAVRGDHDRVAILGHSWGATLGLRYALDHPDRVSALVYVSGTGLGWAWREPFERNLTRRLGEPPEGSKEPAKGTREHAIQLWSAEFTGPDARRHAERMATPWLGVNQQCYDDIWGELRRTWREPELIKVCRNLHIPVLIIDGAHDIRPRWAVDSLEQALPDVARVILSGAGHVPWLDAPGEFSRELLTHEFTRR